MVRLGIIAIFSLLIVSDLALSDDGADLKRMVLEDCNKTEIALAQATPEKKADLIQYLAKVLKIQLEASKSLPSAVVPAVPTNMPAAVDNLRNPNFWTLFDPTKEADAKKCAVKLLDILKPASLDVLVDLVRFADDDSIDKIQREEAGKVVWRIVLTAKGSADFVIKNETVNALLSAVEKDSSSFLLSNILLEFANIVWPILLEQVQSVDPIKRETLFPLLATIAPEVIDLSPLYQMLQYGDDDLRVKIINLLFSLVETRQEVFDVLLKNFVTASSLGKEAYFQNFQKLFAKSNLSLSVKLSEQEFIAFFKEFFKQSPVSFEVANSLFTALIKLSPNNARYLATIFPTHDQNLDLRVIQYLGLYPNTDPEVKRVLFQEAYSNIEEHRLLAIFSLGQQVYDSDEKLGVYLKILKKVFSEKNISAQEQLVQTIAQSIIRFPANTLGLKRIVPYFIEALSLPGNSLRHHIVGSLNFEQSLLLAQNFLGEEILPAILKNLKKAEAIEKARSLRFLRKYISNNLQVSKEIAPLIFDNDILVRKEAIDALSVADQKTIADLKSQIITANAEGRLAITEVLFNRKDFDPKLEKNYKELFTTKSCPAKISYYPVLSLKYQEAAKELSAAFLECFRNETNLEEDLNDLISEKNYDPIIEKAIIDTFEKTTENYMLKSKAAYYLYLFSKDKAEYEQYFIKELQRERYQWALAAISEFNLPEGIELLIKVLKESSDKKKAQIIQAIAGFSEKASSATDEILYYIQDQNELISYQATLALLRISPDKQELKEALKRQIFGRYAAKLKLEKNIPLAARSILEQIKMEAATAVEREVSGSLLNSLAEK